MTGGQQTVSTGNHRQSYFPRYMLLEYREHNSILLTITMTKFSLNNLKVAYLNDNYSQDNRQGERECLIKSFPLFTLQVPNLWQL